MATPLPVYNPQQLITGDDLNRLVAAIRGSATTTGPVFGGGGLVAPAGTPVPVDRPGPPSTWGGQTGAPATPTALSGTSGIDLIAQVNNGFAVVTWAGNPVSDGVQQYTVRWRDAADTTNVYVSLAVAGGTYSTGKIPNLYPGHTYVFQVSAQNSITTSPFSAELSLPIQVDATAPPVPSGLTATSTTKGVWLRWTAVVGTQAGDLAGYDVAVSTDGGLNFPTLDQCDVSVTRFYAYTPLNPSNAQQSLRFMVRSRDWTGNTSAWSNPGTGGTAGQPPYTGAGGVAATVGGLAFDEITVGTLYALGTIGAGGGFTTRAGGTGVGVDVKSTGVAGYNNLNVQTFLLDSATGNVTIAGALGALGITVGSGTSILKVDSTNGLYLGNATFGSAPFRVNYAGNLVASNATITGTITASTIYSSTVATDSLTGSVSSTVDGYKITGGSIRLFPRGNVNATVVLDASANPFGAADAPGGIALGNYSYTDPITGRLRAVYGMLYWSADNGATAGDYIQPTYDGMGHQDIYFGKSADGKFNFSSGVYVNPSATRAGGAFGGNLPVLFYSSILGADTATFDITSIPATNGMNNIQIVYQLASDQAGAPAFYLRFNNDSAGNYYYINMDFSTATTPQEVLADTKGQCGSVTGTGSTNASVGTIMIPNYTGTTWRKQWNHSGTRVDGGGTGQIHHSYGGGGWIGTAAVTRVTLILTAGKFKAGSSVQVYLLPNG